MSYNGSGTFVINSAGMPLVPFQRDLSSTFNALTADLATGLSTAITKDGQTTTTALITFAAGISSTLVTDATSISTGSLLTSGGLGVAKAAWIGGLINVAGAATLQSTLAVSGTSTMAAINASGNINVSSSNIVLTAATGAINMVGALTLAPASANPLITLTDATKGSGYIQGGVNTGGTGAGDYWIFNVPTSRGLSWAVNNSTVLNAVAAGVSVSGALSVSGVATFNGGASNVPSILCTGTANDGLLQVFQGRNTSAGTSAQTRFALGNDATIVGATLTQYSSTHTTRPNYFDIQNEFTAPLRLSADGGSTHVTITSTGVTTPLPVNGVFTNSSNGSTSILAGTTKTFTVTYTGGNSQATATVGFSFLGAGGTSWGGMYYIVTGFPNNSGFYTVTEVIRNVNGSAVISAVTQASGSWTFTFQNTHGSSAADVSWMTSSNQSALTIVGPT